MEKLAIRTYLTWSRFISGMFAATMLLSATPCESANPIGEALNAPNLSWQEEGWWHMETNITHDGESAEVAGTGATERHTTDFLQTTIQGPAALIFWWKVSSLTNVGFIELWLNKKVQMQRCGEVDWEQRSQFIPEGTNVVAWRYTQTYGSSKALNKAWLDQVSVEPPLSPSIADFSPDAVVSAGATMTFSALVSGTEPIVMNWVKDGLFLSMETNKTLVITNVQTIDIGDYALVASNPVGVITSRVARLEVSPVKPSILRQPVSQSVYPGAHLAFACDASGSEPINWQWYFQGAALAGETNANLILSGLRPSQYGEYYATAANAYGATTSILVSLSYTPLIAWGGTGENYGKSIPTTTNISLMPISFLATNVLAMAGGDYHFMTLRRDGSVVVWPNTAGQGTYEGQTNVPPTTTNLAGIAAGSYHCLALDQNGRVDFWGLMLDRNFPDESRFPEQGQVARLALGPGAQHALFLYKDGTVFDTPRPGCDLTTVSSQLSNIVNVAAGADFGTALRANGQVVTWGGGSYWGGVIRRVPASWTNVVDIATGWYHILVLRADGTLGIWGSLNAANIPKDAVDIVAIACGGNHNLALRRDGRIFVWGNNDDQQINVPPWASNIVAVAGSSYGNLVLVGEGPPQISQHPFSPTAVTGDDVRLVGAAVGELPLRYQWLRNGVPIPDATRRWLILTNAQPELAGYSLMASNGLGMTTSHVATVTLSPSAPRILGTNASLFTAENGLIRLSPVVVGSLPCAYQWQFMGTNLEDSAQVFGINTPNLVINPVSPLHLGTYNLVVSNAYGMVTSAVYTVRYGDNPAMLGEAVDSTDRTWTTSGDNWLWQTNITYDGQDAAETRAISANQVAEFYTDVIPPLSVYFRWKVSSETNADLLSFYTGTTNRASISGEVDWQPRSVIISRYTDFVRVRWRYSKNGTGSGGLDRAWVDDIHFGPPSPPTFTTLPTGGRVVLGTPFTLSTAAFGTEPYFYQWRLNGVPLTGATNMTLSITNTQPSNAGTYTVVVSNDWGYDISPPTMLVVDVPAPVIIWHPTQSGGSFKIQWALGVLEKAENVSGPWLPVGNAVSPLTVEPVEPAGFYRARWP